MKRFLASQLAAVLLSVLSTTAQALPSMTLSWVQRTGTVSAFESIDIWVRLAVTETSPGSLILNGQSMASFTSTDLPNYVSIFSVSGQSQYFCGPDASVTMCGSSNSPYEIRFESHFTPQGFIRGFANSPLTINPGGFQDFKLLTLSPKNGSAAPGTYTFASAGLAIQINGLDAAGHQLVSSLVLAQTPTGNSELSFTRTVSAVPEMPATMLFIFGAALLAPVARLRCRSTTAGA